MRSNTGWIVVIVILLAIIAGMAWYLVTSSSPAGQSPLGGAATTTPNPSPNSSGQTPPPPPTPQSPEPLSAKVKITSPASGGKVGKTFTVTGSAPGGWYFEAVFPIQVRDTSGNVLARGQGQAQSDWMTEGLVDFKATVVITGTYKGPASLILMKDNPSGMPEHDDSVTIPIVID